MKFGSYETCKIIFSSLTKSEAFNFILASAVSGAIASVALVRLLFDEYKNNNDNVYAVPS